MFFRTRKKVAELFSLPSRERRRAFRIRPSEDAPITFDFRGRQVRVGDISAGGLSFSGAGCRAGDREPIAFSLPGIEVTVAVDIEVVKVDGDDIAHCRFKGLSPETEDDIHFYVLRRQKEMIRAAGPEPS